MIIHGRVHNGVVILEGGFTLPEGTQVTVSCPMVPAGEPGRQAQRVALPLVPSKYPGTLDLTGERIAELLNEDDAAS